MPTQIDYVLSIDDGPLHALTDLLALPPQSGIALPSRRWLSSQSGAVPSLPKPVLRPSNLIERLAVRLSESYAPEALPAAAELCSAHRGLHPWVVRGVFGLVAGEVTVRCDRLRRYVSQNAEEKGEKSEIMEVVERVLGVLSSVNALWLDEEHFTTLFGKQAGLWRKLRQVESGCEACILAAVGARGEVLVALRASLLARTRGREPRLLRVVESWIGWFEEGGRDVLMRESEGMAGVVRGAMRERRRRRRREKGVKDEKTYPHGSRSSSKHHRHHGRDRRDERDERNERDSSDGRRTPAGTESLRSRDDGSPVYEEHVANWYARSEVQLVGEVRKRSIHPAFQPLPAPTSQSQPRTAEESHTQLTKETQEGSVDEAVEQAEAPPDSSAGITSILDCYGTDEECYGTDENKENLLPTDTDSKESRKASWVTCTVHTSQPADYNPPPPNVPIPFLANEADSDETDAESTVVQLYASSSVYPSEVGLHAPEPEEPLGYTRGFLVEGREWRRVGDSSTRFRDPFAEDRRGGRGGLDDAGQISPRNAGWV